jgi:hypothetical protein
MADEKEHDEQLWRKARKRANFRRSLFVYIVLMVSYGQFGGLPLDVFRATRVIPGLYG